MSLTLLDSSFKGIYPYGFSSIAVSKNGERLVTGYSYAVRYVANQGIVYTYNKIGGVWQRTPQILTGTDTDSERFGVSVAMSADGKILVVGAIKHASLGSYGAVRTYDYIDDLWVLKGQILIPSDKQIGSYFGGTLSLNADGDVLVVGAKSWMGALYRTGTVRTYFWSTDQWVEWLPPLVPLDAYTNKQFGSSVSLSEDGTVLLVGSEQWAAGTASLAGGAAYLFDISGNGWIQRGNPFQRNGVNSTGRFGAHVVLNSEKGYMIVSDSSTDWIYFFIINEDVYTKDKLTYISNAAAPVICINPKDDILYVGSNSIEDLYQYNVELRIYKVNTRSIQGRVNMGKLPLETNIGIINSTLEELYSGVSKEGKFKFSTLKAISEVDVIAFAKVFNIYRTLPEQEMP